MTARTDLTTPSIILIARLGLIDGVNILPKIGNDDAYQKSRKMIYTPYTAHHHTLYIQSTTIDNVQVISKVEVKVKSFKNES